MHGSSFAMRKLKSKVNDKRIVLTRLLDIIIQFGIRWPNEHLFQTRFYIIKRIFEQFSI